MDEHPMKTAAAEASLIATGVLSCDSDSMRVLWMIQDSSCHEVMEFVKGLVFGVVFFSQKTKQTNMLFGGV